MIQYANDTTKEQIRRMWKTVFGDSDAYMDIYFREKYRNNRTLAYFEGDKALASLQMLPYQFTFCGAEIPVAYFSGICTLPEARNKGYMAQLLIKSFDELAQKGIPLAVLVPQEEWLLKVYDKFGFARAFDAGEQDLPSLKALIEQYPGDLHAAYREFNTWFRQNDMTVQKTFDDFKTIVEEAVLFHFPSKKNLLGMARVIDAGKLLSLFSARYPSKNFFLTVTDELLPQNNRHYLYGANPVELGNIDIRQLTTLLLGYHTAQEDEPLHSLFPEKTPQMHFMLE